MLNALNVCEPEMLCVNADIIPSDPALRMIGILSDLYDRELVHIIGWAKQIPGNITFYKGFNFYLPMEMLKRKFI